MGTDGEQRTEVEIRVEDPHTPAAQNCIRAYFAELARRFEDGFDPAASLPADADELVPPHGFLLLARRDGEPVAVGAVKLHGTAPAELKRMWVSDHARGIGLGRRMLAALEDEARRQGATAARLETNRSLTEAIALYRSAGYAEVPAFNDEPYADHWFEKDLTGG